MAEATAPFIVGSGAAGYATRRDLTAIARASFWAERTAVTDQGPARVVHRRDRMASGRPWMELNMSPRSYMQEVPCECHR